MPEITQRIAYGEALAGEPFTAERVIPAGLSEAQLSIRAAAVSHVLAAAWSNKLLTSDRELTEHDLAQKLPSDEEVLRRMLWPKNESRYLLAYSGFDLLDPESVGSDDVQTFMRIETYQSRFNLLKGSYPNVTDLESVGGTIRGLYEKQAAALLHLGLKEVPGARASAAYELAGSDGVEFYENLGYMQTGRRPTEHIGDGMVTYVHLEAGSTEGTLRRIEEQYPWLKE